MKNCNFAENSAQHTYTMPQLQGQYNLQTQQQQLKLSPLQLLTTRLIELSIGELEERVKNEVEENIGLDFGEEGKERDNDVSSYENGSDDGDGADDAEGEEKPDGMADFSIDDYASPDDVPSYIQNMMEAERNEMPLGDSVSFIDSLNEQLMDCDLNDHQRTLVEYLIGSLDSNGFIDAPLYKIADEMLFNHNIETTEEELTEMLHVLQEFDPAGIGARDARECLLLQIDRKMQDRGHLLGDRFFLLESGRRIVDEHFDLFMNNSMERLQAVTGIPHSRLQLVMEELRKLNLHPGLALCESANDRVQTAIPDFIVETDGISSIEFHLNKGDIPALRLSQEYVEQLQMLESSNRRLTRSEQDFVTYMRQKLNAARNFIEAIKLRHNTLTATMKAIIDLQREFFLSQSPDDIKRMVLKDVAEKAKLDISTVSRVCNSKYCLLDGRIYPLRYFFKLTRTNANGEEIDAEVVRSAISEIVGAEDRRNPLTDEQIAERLRKYNIQIKRRTVAKYRDEIGIPTAKKRLDA